MRCLTYLCHPRTLYRFDALYHSRALYRPRVLSLLILMLLSYGGASLTTAAPAIACRECKALLGKGKALERKGKFREAMPFYERAIQIDPKNGMTYYYRGELLWRLEKPKQALPDYDRALARGGNLFKIYEAKGKVYYELNDMPKAVEAVTHAYNAAKNDIDKGDALRFRGKLYCNMREFDKALKDFNASTAVTPTNSMNYKHRGNIYLRWGQYQKALDDFNMALKYCSEPERDLLHSQRATVYEKMGRKDLAEKERKATKNSVIDEWGDFLKN